MGADATLIIGAGGLGKTRRLGELAEGAQGPVHHAAANELNASTPYGALRHLVTPAEDPGAVAEALVSATEGGLLVVDDAEHLDDQSIRMLAIAQGMGQRLAIAHRPIATASSLSALDRVIERSGSSVILHPVDPDDLAPMIASHLGQAAPAELVDELHRATVGNPGLAVRALGDPPGVDFDPDVPSALLVRHVVIELDALAETTRALARVMALSGELPDATLAAVAGSSILQLGDAIDELRIAGLMAPDAETLAPVVVRALRSGITGPERRRIHAAVASALMADQADPVVAAAHLRASGASGEAAAQVFIAAGESCRFRDPVAALDWFDDAEAAGAPADDLAPGRLEASTIMGRTLEDDVGETPADPIHRARMLAVHAALGAWDGRWDRAVERYEAVRDHPTASVAALRFASVPGLVALGRLDEAAAVAAEDADQLDSLAAAARLTARACLHHLRGSTNTGRDFAEAAEAYERLRHRLIPADTPHAIGSLSLALIGDPDAARVLAERSLEAPMAGDPLSNRHRLVRGWLDLRAGRYNLPSELTQSLDADELSNRERLLHAALESGLARRSGDIARMREAWGAAERVMVRGIVDLSQLEPMGELILGAVRLGHHDRADPLIATLDERVAGLGDEPTWAMPLRWLKLNVAVLRDDPAAVDAAHAGMAELTARLQVHHAMQQGAAQWARVMVGEVDPDAVLDAANQLSEIGLPYEASRLSGQAAIRIDDATAARRLLERARELNHLERSTEPGGDIAGLSEREIEVARYVADGLTYKEVGAQLYISPKTVEHHVAKIRQKLGASTRAEMLAALRSELAGSTAD